VRLGLQGAWFPEFQEVIGAYKAEQDQRPEKFQGTDFRSVEEAIEDGTLQPDEEAVIWAERIKRSMQRAGPVRSIPPSR
jgi:hypothetical protein